MIERAFMFYIKSKKNKYGNKRVKTIKGSFDSKLELSHYENLELLQKAGNISNLQRQVSIRLAKSPKCRIIYKADFVFFDNNSKEWVVMDSKGFITDSFRLKKAWFLDNFINFRFDVVFKNNVNVEYPFNDVGIDFAEYIKDSKKLKK